MLIFNCVYCGKETKGYKGHKEKYCCSECCYKDRMKNNDEYKIKKCAWCGKEFRSKYKEQKYCCRQCVDKYQETLVGELSPKFKQVELTCEQCGKKFKIKQSKADKARFCSKECSNIWCSEYQNETERKAVAAERMISMLTNGKIRNTMTKPHIKVNEILDNNGISYENEYSIKYYSIDVYLNEYNLMIEVMGDFWHNNPSIKHNIGNIEKNSKRARKDKAKHTYTLNNYNIEILYLWEYDINNNPDLCSKLINMYIDNNGLLDNYNSFNYHISETGDIILNDIIIYPDFLT